MRLDVCIVPVSSTSHSCHIPCVIYWMCLVPWRRVAWRVPSWRCRLWNACACAGMKRRRRGTWGGIQHPHDHDQAHGCNLKFKCDRTRAGPNSNHQDCPVRCQRWGSFPNAQADVLQEGNARAGGTEPGELSRNGRRRRPAAVVRRESGPAAAQLRGW